MLKLSVEPARIIKLPLRHLTARVHHFPTLGSTSTFLKEYAQQQNGELEGICALADQQTAGRGRMDRVWHSPAGEGFYFSMLLQPRLAATELPLLTLMAAIAAAETITTICPRGLDIKWPNDILIANRKIAGILTEASFEGSRLSYLVLGIGINLSHKFFPPEINQLATSLYLETGLVVTPEQLLKELLQRLDHWYGVLQNAPAGIIERWQHLSSFAAGKQIYVDLDGQQIIARTCGLTAGGALRAETSDGRLVTLYGSEVTAVEKEVAER